MTLRPGQRRFIALATYYEEKAEKALAILREVVGIARAGLHENPEEALKNIITIVEEYLRTQLEE